MSTFTANATQLKFVRSAGSSSWENGRGAYQGRYTGGSPRVGAMYFPTLLSIPWDQQIISSIKLRFTFAQAGGDFVTGKTLGLYRGAKTGGISGTGTSMRGASLGGVGFYRGWGSTQTATLSASGNAGVFGNFVAWLQQAPTDTLVLYVNEGLWSDHDYSYNYCSVTAAAIIIEYEPAGSDGTLNKTTVNAGDTVTLTVTPPDGLEGTITHAVQWTFGSYAQTQQLASGVLNANFAIPMTWLNAIPNSASGPAVCRLTTYLDGEERGEKKIPFTIAAPASAGPTFTGGIAPAGQVTAGYYQYLSAARVTISEAAAQYGATVRAYSITGPGYLGGVNAAQFITGAFRQSGTHVFTLAVTDSRGLRTVKTLSCNVIAVSLPTITQFAVDRYSIIEGDTTQYVQTDYGEHVWVSIAAQIDGAGGHNSGTAYIEYGPVGAAKTRVNLAFSGNAIQMSNDRTVITAEISPDQAYEFTLYIADTSNSAQRYDSISRGTCAIHVAGSGYGVGIGRFVNGATAENPQFACAWPARFEDNVRLEGNVGFGGDAPGASEDVGYRFHRPVDFSAGARRYMTYSASETDTGNVWLDGKKIYARILGYTTKDGYNSVEHDYDLSAMDLVWVDQSASFLIYEEGTSVPHGYVASNGDRQFMAQPRPQSNTILVVSDGPGIAYIRLLYTKTTG